MRHLTSNSQNVNSEGLRSERANGSCEGKSGSLFGRFLLMELIVAWLGASVSYLFCESTKFGWGDVFQAPRLLQQLSVVHG